MVYVTSTTPPEVFQTLDQAMEHCESVWSPVIEPGWRRHSSEWATVYWTRKGVNDAGEIVTQSIYKRELR